MTSGWVAVAKKDFRDAIRVRYIWIVTAIFVLFAAGATVLYAQVDLFHGGNPTAGGLISFVRSATTLFVPIIALMAGYRSVAGEREDGHVRLLLSMPVTRLDVVLGKLLGRTAVVVVPAVIAYLIAAVVGVVLMGGFDYLQFLSFGLITAVYALAYVSVAVGFSAASRSTSKALVGVVLFWALFNFFWSSIAFGLLWITSPGPFPSFDPVPAWYVLFTRLSPSGAFSAASSTFIPGGVTAAMPTGMGATGGVPFSMPSGPFFVEPWFGFLPLVAWIVVPAAVGYWRFEAADI